MKKLKAYKVFNENWICKEHDFKTNNGSAIGSKHVLKGKLELCNFGFHACEKVADCFTYYSFDPKNKVAEVELFGTNILGINEDKQCALGINIIKELSWSEMLELANIGEDNSGLKNSGDQNSGYRNSGYRNSGDRNSGDQNSGYQNSGYLNSGDRNSGYQNSGYQNSGYRNSGDLNSGDLNSGYRNSGIFCNKKENDKAILFNKESNWTWDEWHNSNAYNYTQYLELTIWVPEDIMSEQEKINYPKSSVTGGYLKVISYKEAWLNLWNNFDKEAKDCIKALPNFEAEVFEDITGIKV